MTNGYINDSTAFVASFLFVLIYYFYLSRKTRLSPDSSVYAINAKVRERWVEMVSHSDKMDILAIQTLRNSLMAANFMASTSILLIIGTLNLGEKIGTWSIQWHDNPLIYNASNGLWQIKLAILLLDFFIAFYCFSMSIRFYNHIGYMINLPKDSINAEHIKLNCLYLNRAGNYYRLGTRTFFFSLPIIMWFFGPYSLLLATVGLIVALALLDRIPS